jgi:hypothetical protein
MAIRLSPGVYNPVDSVDINRLFFSGLKIPLVFLILYTRYEQVIHDKSTGYAHNEIRSSLRGDQYESRPTTVRGNRDCEDAMWLLREGH